MHHPTDRIAHTMAFVTPVMEHWLDREIAQWVHPMKDQSDDPSHHEQTLLPQSYILLLHFKKQKCSRDHLMSKISANNWQQAGKLLGTKIVFIVTMGRTDCS